eukprot:m.206675 g.206675  ORF g.206675 m.206675 type:complete len:82 (-) comp25361_c0_seq2:725-970(-)
MWKVAMAGYEQCRLGAKVSGSIERCSERRSEHTLTGARLVARGVSSVSRSVRRVRCAEWRLENHPAGGQVAEIGGAPWRKS